MQNMPMKINPNPTTGLIKIEGIDAESIQVIGITGKTELTTRVTNNELNLSKLTPGQYVIQAIDDEGKVHSSKVIRK